MDADDISNIGRALRGLTADQARPVAQVLASSPAARRFGWSTDAILRTYVSPLTASDIQGMRVAGRSRTLRAALVTEGVGAHVHPETLTPTERRNLVSCLQQRARAAGLILRTATHGGRFYYSLWAPGTEPPAVRGQSAERSVPAWVWDVSQPSTVQE